MRSRRRRGRRGAVRDMCVVNKWGSVKDMWEIEGDKDQNWGNNRGDKMVHLNLVSNVPMGEGISLF